MSKRVADLFTNQNLQLFDMLFRHQVYLEGWKTGLADGYRELLRKLYGEFALFLRQTRYQSVDQFTKAQLYDFVRKFTFAQDKFYSSFTDDLIKVLKQFLADDVVIHKQIMEAVTARTVEEISKAPKETLTQAEYDALSPAMQADYQAIVSEGGEPDPEPDEDVWVLTAHAREVNAHNEQASGMYGLAVVDGSDDANDQLWSNIINAPMPANGQLMLKAIAGFGTSTSVRTAQQVQKGYANSWTMQGLEESLLGVGPDFAGGLFGIFLAQFNSLIATVVQHVSAEAQGAVSSVYFEQYQWVAIMDNRTTVICRDRNGVVYVYGAGPLPPAHFNCRSKAVPVASGQHLHNIPDSYFDWLQTQPLAFLEDILGSARAKQLLAGELPSDNFAQISTVKPLTLEEFQGKVKYILGDF